MLANPNYLLHEFPVFMFWDYLLYQKLRSWKSSTSLKKSYFDLRILSSSRTHAVEKRFFSQKILSKWRTDKFYKNETFCFVGFWNDSICFLFVPQTEAAADTEKELFVVDDNDVLVEILVFQETVLYSEVGKNANNSIDPKSWGINFVDKMCSNDCCSIDYTEKLPYLLKFFKDCCGLLNNTFF